MINTLDDYIKHSLPAHGNFSTNPNLIKKANENGGLLPFFGNTVVYLLDNYTKCSIAALQDELYCATPFMFSEKLKPDTFHMTVHDLANGHINDIQLQERMAVIYPKARDILRREKPNHTLRMKTTWMFNMVNMSIVLGLTPSDAESYRILDRLYCSFEEITPLGYAFTPHITLAYFRPGIYGEKALAKLRDFLHSVEMEISLEPQNLVIQNFTDMNTYRTISDSSGGE